MSPKNPVSVLPVDQVAADNVGGNRPGDRSALT
jgi:hypothetical protein